MNLGWLKKRLRELDRTWWYVGYSYVSHTRLSCSGMIYTLATQGFSLVAVQRDLERRLGTSVVTILSWTRLTPQEGEQLAEYFKARLAEDLARAKATQEPPPKPQLTLVKLEEPS